MTEVLDRIRLVLQDHRPVNCGTERVRCSCRHQWMSEKDYREHVAARIAAEL